MSKPKLVVSLTIAVAALIAVGWWAARAFWPMAPPASSAQMVAYAVMQQTAGGPVPIALHVITGVALADEIKGPVPVSMPTAPFTSRVKKNKVKGDAVALLIVDASGSFAGATEVTIRGKSPEDAEKLAETPGNLGAVLANSLTDIMHTWKFKPAMEKGKPVSAMVIVQLRF